jgi:hypothetical protein
MRIIRALQSSILLLFLMPNGAVAMQVSSEYLNLRPLSGAAVHITMIGEIETGDADKVAAEVAKYVGDPDLRYLFLFNSPGGNLAEGLRLGEYIASLGELTTSQVGTMLTPDAICASACVYAFLGANYRELGGGRIGVHRFYGGEDYLNGAEALDLSQTISAAIASYLRSRRVDPAFFDDIVATPPNQINWVSEERLIEVGALTHGVADETVEYVNRNGKLALHIAQNAQVGNSTLTLSCGEMGLVGVSTLTEPELAAVGRTVIVVGETEYTAINAQVVAKDGYLVTSSFFIPPSAAKAMLEESNVGVRIIFPREDIFFGFLGTVSDPKISETVLNCSTQASQSYPMQRLADYDIEGGDFEDKGVRGISLDDCEQLCMALPACKAVSYVVSRSWCWPKGTGGTVKNRAGITSSIKD